MKIYFTAQYEHPSGTAIQLQTDWTDEKNAFLFLNDFEKTGRFNSITVHDDLGQQWNIKEFKKLMNKTAGAAKDITIHFDAAFSKSDLKAGLGWVINYIKDGTEVVEKRNKLITQIHSNNEAEYAALYYAIQHALDIANGHTQILTSYGDALTITNQMSGEWPCYDQELVNWADKIDHLLKKHGMQAEYYHIGRNLNREAHRLSRQAIEETEIKSLNRNDRHE